MDFKIEIVITIIKKKKIKMHSNSCECNTKHRRQKINGCKMYSNVCCGYVNTLETTDTPKMLSFLLLHLILHPNEV